MHTAGEKQRDGKSQHVDQQGGHDGERRCEPERMGEGVIRPNHCVVGELAERQPCTPDKRPDKANNKGDEGRQYENRPITSNGFFHKYAPFVVIFVFCKRSGAGETARPANR